MEISNREEKNSPIKIMTVLLMVSVMFFISSVNSGYAAGKSRQTFGSPDAAFSSMIAAFEAGNSKKIAAIFGPEGHNIYPAEKDAGGDRRERFVKAYEERHKIEMEGEKKAVLHVGPNDWPWPIPVVKSGTRWYFDTAAGMKEIIARRVGKNEVAAVQVCLAYVDAQLEYAHEDRNGKLEEYAQYFVSEPGRHNGLCGSVKMDEKEGKLGPLVAQACKTEKAEWQAGMEPQPYHGYFYKILKGQGKDAPGGAYNYVIDDKMIGGFALVAYPAMYGSSGITTFIVNQQDIVYQKDLGKDTKKIAEAMTIYNPDATWKKVD